MERVLLKMAKQLNEYDEASLTALWERYARLVQEFEPSRRWEEASLVFSFIQAVRFKNQLFNKHLAENARPGGTHPQAELVREISAWAERGAEKGPDKESGKGPGKGKAGGRGSGNGTENASGGPGAEKRCKVLHFRRSKTDKPV